MRKLLFVVTMASALIAVALAGPASATPRAASSWELADGSGTLGQFGNPTVVIHALGTTSGTQGGFVITYPDGTYVAGSPTCLMVIGKAAYLTGRIILSHGARQQAGNWLSGNYVVIGVQDNSKPSPAQPDMLNFSPGYATNPGCGPSTGTIPVFPITRGHFRVATGSSRP
ncbi:MAG: hypothetical protein JO345_31195 [Streptosporangiaceae bacterium]|nr:hypothetical protein [Streptosporangiaceae bacterium]